MPLLLSCTGPYERDAFADAASNSYPNAVSSQEGRLCKFVRDCTRNKKIVVCNTILTPSIPYMQKVVLIIFDLKDFRFGSPQERIVVNQHDKVRFEITNKDPDGSHIPFFDADFVVEFKTSPFGPNAKEFRTNLSNLQDVKLIGEATAGKPGEYKFSYGTKLGRRWDVEVDPLLVVLPSDFDLSWL